MLFTADRPLPIKAAQAIAMNVMSNEYSIRSCPSSSRQSAHIHLAIGSLHDSIRLDLQGNGK
jgi:hypothetical protein